MRKTFSLLALSLGVLLFSTAAQADTVTFTLTCDRNVTAELKPTALNGGGGSASIWVVNANDTQRESCNITFMQCDGPNKTDTQPCTTPSGFVPAFYFTSDGLDATLTVTAKNGRTNSCIAAGATDGSSFSCDPPTGGLKVATLSASSPHP